jgi:hypothetical protein
MSVHIVFQFDNHAIVPSYIPLVSLVVVRKLQMNKEHRNGFSSLTPVSIDVGEPNGYIRVMASRNLKPKQGTHADKILTSQPPTIWRRCRVYPIFFGASRHVLRIDVKKF